MDDEIPKLATRETMANGTVIETFWAPDGILHGDSPTAMMLEEEEQEPIKVNLTKALISNDIAVALEELYKMRADEGPYYISYGAVTHSHFQVAETIADKIIERRQ